MSLEVLKPVAMLAFYLAAAAESTPCRDFKCPTGHALRADALNLSPSDFETCCEPMALDTAQLLVQSAGFSDGSFASFKLNGQLIHSSTQTGLTVMVLRTRETKVEPNAIVSVQTFNTMQDSSGLEAFLEQLPEGSNLLMAVSDSACCKFSGAAQSLVEEFGATMIRDLKFRSSYALIVMNGRAAAEDLRHEGEGIVSVQALAPVADYLERPTCDGRVVVPPVSGMIFNQDLVLDAGCRYELWDRSATQSALAGNWIVLTGASNLMLKFSALLSLLTSGEQGQQSSWQSVFFEVWSSHVMDVVVNDGRILYKSAISMLQPECKQLQSSSSSFPACQEYLKSFLAKAPGPGKATRVTMVLTQFWPAVPFLLETFEADQGWADVPIGLVVQISTWYSSCNFIQFAGCPRPELMAESGDENFERFKLELAPAMETLKTFCNGRAKLGCVLGSASHGRKVNSESWTVYKRYYTEVGRAVINYNFSNLRFVDFDELGAGMPEETLSGHGAQVLHFWSWQVMLAGFFPGGPGTGLSRAVFSGPMCSAVDASMTLCPAYQDRCSNYDACVLWMCMNSVQCDFGLTSIVGTEPRTSATTNKPSVVSQTTTTPVTTTGSLTTAAADSSPCGDFQCPAGHVLRADSLEPSLCICEPTEESTSQLSPQSSFRNLMLCLAGSSLLS